MPRRGLPAGMSADELAGSASLDGTQRQYTLRHLRAFVALAESRSFTLAAERLGVSKSNLSDAISSLEASTGLRLFDRTTRRVAMTPRAIELLPRLKQTLSELDELVEAARDGTEGEQAVRVAVLPALAVDMMPRLIKTVMETLPTARVQVIDCNRPQIIDAVRSGEADFGFALAQNLPPDLRGQQYFVEEFVAVLPPDHSLAGHESLVWADLHRFPLIGPTSDQVLYSILLDENRRHGHVLNLRYQTILQTTILGMAAQGLGIGLAPARMHAVIERMGLVWKWVRGPVIRYELDMVLPRDRPLSAAATRLRNALFDIRANVAPPVSPAS